MTQTPQREPVAIVGIGCRFPGGIADPVGFWRALADRLDAITAVPADRFDADALFQDGPPAPGRIGSRRGGFLEGIDGFDPSFFGISPREAELLDPQQRLLLETSWEALEDAGQEAARLRGGRTGVYVGLWLNDFEARLFADPAVEFHMTTGSGRYAASGRISYALGLQGPSVTVDTACSSSLVAVHLACRSIWSGECPLAIAGGANVILQPHITIAYSQSGMMAADGRCKFGDARASGYVRSEGAAMVVLKPLSRALADGDRVYALIRGSAVNNDGRSGDYMATPAQAGQEQMLRLAYEDAGVTPGRVAYVEAHGTGTAAGDPVELGALGAVLKQGRPAGQRCAVGSVKTNFGHTEGAAGVAGLIKAALALRNREIPASLHFETPNPTIPWSDLPLFVAGERIVLEPGEEPLVAGVSSFGIAGTNAHVVLEEFVAAAAEPATTTGGPRLVPLSAHSEDALRAAAARWAERLSADDAPRLADWAHTAGLRRDHHAHRLAVVADDAAGLARELAAAAAGGGGPVTAAGERRPATPRVVFVFPGQGSQWPGMGRELIAAEPVFRAALEACEAAMRPWVEWSLMEQLGLDPDGAGWLLDRIDVVQPTLVSLDIALAALWRAWGVEPAAVVGHSMGEVAAACVAGALTLDDAMRVICLRSQLLRRISGQGAMAVVELPRTEAAAALAGYEDRVSVAASNSPRSTILAGEPAALREVLESLERAEVFCRSINVDVASHSPQVEPLRAELLEALDGIEPLAPGVAFHSTVLGRRVEGAELDAGYWALNLRQPVLLNDTVQGLLDEGNAVFVEVSPHPVLLPALQQTIQHAGSDGFALGSLRRAEPERATLLRALAELYVAGVEVAWAGVNPGGRFVALPAYPWQRERYWFEPPARRSPRSGSGGAHPIFGDVARSAAGHQIWESELDLATAPYLADHRVRGRPLLPAAAVLEVALAAGAEAGRADVTLEDFSFDQAVPVGDSGAARRLQVVVERDSAEASTLTLFSRAAAAADEPWARCAAGRLLSAEATAVPEAVLPLGARNGDGAAADEHYARLESRGLDYGPAFRGVERVWTDGTRVVGRVRLPDTLRGGAAAYRIHPALLDSCLQLLLQTLVDTDADGTWVPVRVRRLTLRGVPGHDAALWASAVRRPDAGSLLGDLVLQDEQGRTLLEAEGVRFHHVAAADSGESLEDWAYGIEWAPQAVPAASSASPAASSASNESGAAEPGSWLLLGDRGGVADALEQRLQRMGASCIVVRAAAGGAAGQAGSSERQIDPGRPDAFDGLLAELADERPLAGIVHLWSLDAAPAGDAGADELDAAQLAGSVGVLHLVQSLNRLDGRRPPRVWLVTRGAQAAGGAEALPGLAHAPLWGMAGVLINEHPELRCSCVDLAPDADGAVDDIAAELADELVADGPENRVAFRAGERRVARVVRRPPASPPEPSPPATTRRIGAPYAVVTAGAGVLDNLRVEPRPRAAAGAGEVEIEVRAVGLNFMNVMSALGTYPGYPDGLGPLGIECAGVVTAVGAGVDEFGVGDEVVAFAFDCLATHAVADARLVAPKPAGLGFDEAATVPIAFLTASYALEHLGRMAPGERVLIHSAAGGVGLAAIQLARAAGAEIFATAGTEAKREHLRALGIRHVWDSRSLGFADEVVRATAGEGVDIVLNSLAGEAITRGLSVLRPFGRFIELGKRDIHDNVRIGLAPFRNQLSYSAVDLDRGARERADLVGPLLRRVVARVAAGELTPLPATLFPVSEAADAFRRMARARHTGKVVITIEPEAETVVPAGSLRADATYLITGGLGALGLEVARWMVGQGARQLVLVGRSAPSAGARQALAELHGLGATVQVETADVAREADVARVLRAIDSSMAPLAGVVHAAGLLADATLQQLDAGRLALAMAPKLRGAWNLHRLTRDRPLDLFVLFSSASATLGIPGQANYAAANAFLDALAQHRAAAGLAALSIAWGPWSAVGLAAERADRGRRLVGQGLGSLAPAQAIGALRELLTVPQPPQLMVARFDAGAWCEAHPGAAASPLFERLRQADADARPGRPADAHEAREAILRVAGRERQALLEAHLRTSAAQVLRLAPDRVALGRPLKSLGMDSLMGLELRNRIEAGLGVALSATAIWNYPTISLLAAHLADRLAPAAVDPAAPADDASGQAEPDAADSAFVELDRTRLESLLDRELAAIDDLLDGDSRDR